MAIIFNKDELREKIYGCWMGKSIGGTLGTPFEGQTAIQNVKGYSQPTNGEPLPNDDLDLQLVWLKAMQDYGPKGVNSHVLGEYWLNFIPPHWNEYGISKSNQKAGLIPPLSGEYHNERWKNSNGAWIRSEIWACLCPGCPDIAIKYAYEDASVDHGGGEGTYAELFTAAIESAAFVISERNELIKIGLSKIPKDCRIAKSVNIVLDAYANGLNWKEVRELVVNDSKDLGWFQAPANIAFFVIGWLYGEGDFGKSICIATNCGDDTDCTAATLGAILGIIMGKIKIPSEWSDPIGDRIITVAIDRGSICAPDNLTELTKQVMAQTPQVLAAFGKNIIISDAETDLSDIAKLEMTNTEAASEIWKKTPYSVTYDFIHTKATLDYCKEPSIKANEAFKVKVTLENNLPDTRHIDLIWHLPEGWKVQQGSKNRVVLDLWPPKKEVCIDIIADNVEESTYRGILEIFAPGRPTVGYIPLLFFGTTF